MNKIAWVWTTTESYMPGTNATLNAMEFYGIKNVDIYILTWTDFLSKDYKKQFKNINFIPIESDGSKPAKWYLRFADFTFAKRNLKKYDVILFWGGDVCLVNDISVYFEISSKLKKIIVGTNEHGSHVDFRMMSKDKPYIHTWSVPYTDVPLFIPKKWYGVISKTLEYQKEGMEISKMDGLNYAIRDLNADVFTVPGELWVFNAPYKIKLLKKEDKLYFANSSTTLNSFHRRYWASDLCRKYFAVN